ncbi:WD repeat containing protein [Parasponia andersonii]|uniref:WD repeat containing protein n=1 Tax=Parasponia andersonii TaxID=3476 RepID=A0A2P5CGK2_PARAD|nr:WD repeat containing protein [Parasponia andersonii]
MSYQQAYEFDYMADEGEMAHFLDEMDEEIHAGDAGIDEYEMLTKVTDTSSSQARKGKDIQGIPWDRLNITRKKYRLTRLEQYRNYENIPLSGEAVDKECKQMEKGANYYEFFYNTRLVKPTILHFQLRNLVWASSKHDVYLISNCSVMHWSSLAGNLSEILNFAGHVAPTEKHAGSILEGFSQTQISTLAVKDNFLVAGGFQGELICKRLDKQGVSFCTRTTYDDNAITNAVEIYESLRGGTHFLASNNDCGVREYDMERFQLLNHFRFPWPVNNTSVSPDRRLLAIVGDHIDGLLVDSQSGKTVATVVGHLDYSFASAWHPDGRIFATGNQDKTCRVWDIRNLSSPLAVLKGNLGAARSIRFSANGEFMVVAEPADFVHVYSTRSDYKKRQEIDFFGEISGVSLSPDDESLYIGIWDRTYASLLQYNRRHKYGYLDSYL